MIQKEEVLDHLLKKVKEQMVTLLYAAKDEKHNHALVLKEFLDEQVN